MRYRKELIIKTSVIKSIDLQDYNKKRKVTNHVWHIRIHKSRV